MKNLMINQDYFEALTSDTQLLFNEWAKMKESVVKAFNAREADDLIVDDILIIGESDSMLILMLIQSDKIMIVPRNNADVKDLVDTTFTKLLNDYPNIFKEETNE